MNRLMASDGVSLAWEQWGDENAGPPVLEARRRPSTSGINCVVYDITSPRGTIEWGV
jgi:hypothetical protein